MQIAEDAGTVWTEKQNKKEQECEELAEKHKKELAEQVLDREMEVEAWKVKCRASYGGCYQNYIFSHSIS